MGWGLAFEYKPGNNDNITERIHDAQEPKEYWLTEARDADRHGMLPVGVIREEGGRFRYMGLVATDWI